MGREETEAQFPVLGGIEGFGSVPWSLVAPHEARAISTHGQPLWKLARRGGLSYDELLAVIEDRDLQPGFKRDPQAAHKVMAHVQRFKAKSNG